MSNTLREKEHTIWNKYHEEHGGFFEPVSFMETAKGLYPEMTYRECAEMVLMNSTRDNTPIPYSPEVFVQFAKAMIEQIQPSSVCFSYADGSESEIAPDMKGADYWFPNKRFEQLAKRFVPGIKVLEDKPQREYDFVIADLPLSAINKKSEAVHVVEANCENIGSEGYGIFTFSIALTYESGRSWLCELEKKGLYCNAIMDMPLNSYGYLTHVETVIAVFSKKKRQRLFVASLSNDNITTVVKNLVEDKESDRNPKAGIYVDDDVFSYGEFDRRRRIESKNKALAKAYNGVMKEMSKIGRGTAAFDEGEEKSTAIYIPKNAEGKVATSKDEIVSNIRNYYRFIVNEEVVLPRFLAFFLNSEEGKSLRKLYARGAVVKTLSMHFIEQMMIPCPSIDIQLKYMSTLDQIDALRTEIDALGDRFVKIPASYKNILTQMKEINNHGDRFAQWIELLPYPIATILKRYSVSDNVEKRQESLFHFFEAYSIFESTILSAALDKKMIDCTKLTNVDPAYFEKASFGNWVRMDRALSKLYLDLLNSKNDLEQKVPFACFHTADDVMIKLLCNKQVCSILEQAGEKRNLWKGHVGITNEVLYKDHVDTLDNMLHKLRDNIKDLYERIRLIRPLSLSFENGQFVNRVEVLTGSNPIFRKETIVSPVPLDKAKLYLQVIDTGETMELPPYFIMKDSPADVKNACYFYSRVEGGNTRYVSYHYDGRPEDTENGEEAFNIIKELLTN